VERAWSIVAKELVWDMKDTGSMVVKSFFKISLTISGIITIVDSSTIVFLLYDLLKNPLNMTKIKGGKVM
jgi:hypothetical protein